MCYIFCIEQTVHLQQQQTINTKKFDAPNTKNKKKKMFGEDNDGRTKRRKF